MLFNSIQFLIFFPIVVLLYFAIPRKLRNLWLLAASYYFYMCWNPTYALLIAFSTVITWLSGLLIHRVQTKYPMLKWGGIGWVWLSFVINLSILFFFKYFNFIVSDLLAGVSAVFPEWNLRPVRLSLVLPVGISFYTFQALSYSMDVYRGDVKVERNLLRYALFVSFFPQLVAGPIERSSNLLEQFYKDHQPSYENIRSGLLLMVFGFFQKLVISDRLAILVNQVFDHYTHYNGLSLFIAAICFAFQIYCDFGGYSNIAIGAAQVMGFRLMNNFDTPYFSRSIAEFWRRWHISLSSWFRDYLYIPLGGSRRGQHIKNRNLMIVFLASGMWHGAGWNYIVWGGLNGLFQILGQKLKPLRKAILRRSDKTDSFSHKVLQMLLTFFLVDFTWVFFRAPDIRSAFGFLWRMVSTFRPLELVDGTILTLGLSGGELLIAVIALLLLLGTSVLHYQGMEIRKTLARQELWFRWTIYLCAIFFVLIFGIYGPGFDASQFIYFQF